MILSIQQINELDKLADPLVKWINDNCHPNCKIIIEPGRIEVWEGICSLLNEKHIKD